MQTNGTRRINPDLIPKELLDIAIILAEKKRSRLWAKLIREGQKRAKERGIHIGRPSNVRFDKAEVLRLRLDGHSIRKIKALTGASVGSVHRIIQQERFNNGSTPCKHCGLYARHDDVVVLSVQSE